MYILDIYKPVKFKNIMLSHKANKYKIHKIKGIIKSWRFPPIIVWKCFSHIILWKIFVHFTH